MTKLLFLIGIALLTAGIVIVILTKQWSIISIILLAIGSICFLCCTTIGYKKSNKLLPQRSNKFTIKTFVSTAFVLAILGLINFYSIRYPLRIDLTENKIFTLTPQSIEIAKNITQPLKISIIDRNIDPETQTLLKNYQRYSKNFSYQLVDPNTKIDSTQPNIVNTEFVGETYIEYNNKKQLLSTSVTPLGTNISEANLGNAIAKIKHNPTPYIYFLQGHGEPAVNITEVAESEFSQAVSALIERGYIVKPLNLDTSQKIPQNADIIAIAKPLKKLSDTEASTIQQYLENGGNLLIMLMPYTDINLQSIWQSWGIELDNRLVIDGLATKRSPVIISANRYGDHPITRSLNNGITLFAESRIIQTTNKDNITATPIVITSENTWAESNLAEDKITFNPQEDIRGSLNIAIALSKENASRMVIFGNANFATNDWFKQQLNSDLFLNSVEWLADEDKDILSIQPREFTNRRLNLTSFQAQLLNWLAIRITPSFGFILAFIFWWKQR